MKDDARGERRWPIIEYVSAIVGCVLGGFMLAVVLTVIAAVMWQLGGREDMSAKFGSLREVSAIYFRGCVGGGLLVGCLSPLARWRIGVLVLGWVAAAIIYLTAIGDRWGPIRSWGMVEGALTLLAIGTLGTVGALQALRMMGRHRVGRRR